MSIDHDRRRMLKALLAGLPLVGSAAIGAPLPTPAASSPSHTRPAAGSVVAIGHRKGILDPESGGRKPHAAKLDEALGAVIARAGGEESPAGTMRRLFKKTDVVGIKVNCLAGRGMSPHPELVARLTSWLQEAGVPAGNIVIWDRSDRELRRAGFRPSGDRSSVRCIGTNDDYDWEPREWGPGGSCFAKLLTNDFTALINVGVLKDHDLAGVSAGLKNWYGVIHNPNKYHDDGCAPFIPHLAAFPLIRDKLRLTVIDAMTAQCQGGPARSPNWCWPMESVIASTDPVAVDAAGRKFLDERRVEVGLKPLAECDREPTWIAEAGRIGLGQADMERIKLEEV